MATRRTVKEMADKLISTLDTLMPSDQADAIVRDVAEELYNDVLGIKGKIVVDPTAPTGMIHGAFGKNGKKDMKVMAKYRFEKKR